MFQSGRRKGLQTINYVGKMWCWDGSIDGWLSCQKEKGS